jgi:hypothetical protein
MHPIWREKDFVALKSNAPSRGLGLSLKGLGGMSIKKDNHRRCRQAASYVR